MYEHDPDLEDPAMLPVDTQLDFDGARVQENSFSNPMEESNWMDGLIDD